MKNWIKKNRKNLELWTLISLMISVLLITSCTIQPINTPQETPERDMEELEPLYEACEEWIYHDGESWMNCIMHEERRRHLLKKFEKMA